MLKLERECVVLTVLVGSRERLRVTKLVRHNSSPTRNRSLGSGLGYDTHQSCKSKSVLYALTFYLYTVNSSTLFGPFFDAFHTSLLN